MVFGESGLLSSTLLSPTCVVEVLVVAHNNHDQLLSAGPSLAHQWSSRPRWSGGEAAIHQCTHPYIPTMPAHLSHSLPAATTATIAKATPIHPQHIYCWPIYPYKIPKSKPHGVPCQGRPRHQYVPKSKIPGIERSLANNEAGEDGGPLQGKERLEHRSLHTPPGLTQCPSFPPCPGPGVFQPGSACSLLAT